MLIVVVVALAVGVITSARIIAGLRLAIAAVHTRLDAIVGDVTSRFSQERDAVSVAVAELGAAVHARLAYLEEAKRAVEAAEDRALMIIKDGVFVDNGERVNTGDTVVASADLAQRLIANGHAKPL